MRTENERLDRVARIPRAEGVRERRRTTYVTCDPGSLNSHIMPRQLLFMHALGQNLGTLCGPLERINITPTFFPLGNAF